MLVCGYVLVYTEEHTVGSSIPRPMNVGYYGPWATSSPHSYGVCCTFWFWVGSMLQGFVVGTSKQFCLQFLPWLTSVMAWFWSVFYHVYRTWQVKARRTHVIRLLTSLAVLTLNCSFPRCTHSWVLEIDHTRQVLSCELQPQPCSDPPQFMLLCPGCISFQVIMTIILYKIKPIFVKTIVLKEIFSSLWRKLCE